MFIGESCRDVVEAGQELTRTNRLPEPEVELGDHAAASEAQIDDSSGLSGTAERADHVATGVAHHVLPDGSRCPCFLDVATACSGEKHGSAQNRSLHPMCVHDTSVTSMGLAGWFGIPQKIPGFPLLC